MNFIENPAFTSAVISEDIILQKIGDQIHFSCPVGSEEEKNLAVFSPKPKMNPRWISVGVNFSGLY